MRLTFLKMDDSVQLLSLGGGKGTNGSETTQHTNTVFFIFRRIPHFFQEQNRTEHKNEQTSYYFAYNITTRWSTWNRHSKTKNGTRERELVHMETINSYVLYMRRFGTEHKTALAVMLVLTRTICLLASSRAVRVLDSSASYRPAWKADATKHHKTSGATQCTHTPFIRGIG